VADADLVPLLVALPLGAAALVRVPRIASSRLADVVGVATAAAVALVAGVLTAVARDGPLVHHVGGWSPEGGRALGIPLVADVASAGFVAFAGICFVAALWWLGASPERQPASPTLTLLLLGAISGFVLAGDLFTLFVMIELLSIAVVAVTGGKVEDPAAVPSAINLAVVGTIGAVFLLTGVGLLYRVAGTPNLAQVGEVLTGTPSTTVLGAAGLVLAGLAIKAGLAPFHLAHVDVHTATWTPHAGLFGALVLPIGLVGIVRVGAIALDGLAGADDLVRGGLLVAAVVTALAAAVMSLLQDQLKRLLAFSSVAHLGIAGMGAALGGADGAAGAAAYVVGHGVVKLGLLLAAGIVLHRLGSLHLRDLTGRGREVPLATALLAVGALLLAGVPPSGMHVGKAGITGALDDAGHGLLVPLVYVAAALTGAALARVVAHLWAGWALPEDDIGIVEELHPETLLDRTPATLALVPAVLLLAGTVLPLAPGALDVVGSAGAALGDAEAHRSAVLAGERTTTVAAAELEPWEASALRSGTATTLLGAVGGLACARWWRRGRHPATAPLRWLRLAHSGIVNDQVTWLTAAVAVWLAWVVGFR
jgi:multicomponent Na+:H+ antiporter subunit D